MCKADKFPHTAPPDGRCPRYAPCVPPVPERGKTAWQSRCFPQPGRAVGLIVSGTPSSRLSCPGAQLLAAMGSPVFDTGARRDGPRAVTQEFWALRQAIQSRSLDRS